MPSQFFGLDCEDHCACAPEICNLFLGCSARYRNDTDIDYPWKTKGYTIEPKYPITRSASKRIDDNYNGFFIVFGILCIYSFITPFIIIVMRIRKKQINIVYRVGIPPTDAHSPSEDFGANQDSRQNTLVHDAFRETFS